MKTDFRGLDWQILEFGKIVDVQCALGSTWVGISGRNAFIECAMSRLDNGGMYTARDFDRDEGHLQTWPSVFGRYRDGRESWWTPVNLKLRLSREDFERLKTYELPWCSISKNSHEKAQRDLREWASELMHSDSDIDVDGLEFCNVMQGLVLASDIFYEEVR